MKIRNGVHQIGVQGMVSGYMRCAVASCGFMFLMSVTACSSSKYAPVGISNGFQGYWEDQVDSETFTVSFHHRGKTATVRAGGPEVARILALYRCAELVSEKGGQYFEVLETSNLAGGCDYTQSDTRPCDYPNEFTQSYTIKVLQERPESKYRDIYDTIKLQKLLRGKHPALF